MRRSIWYFRTCTGAPSVTVWKQFLNHSYHVNLYRVQQSYCQLVLYCQPVLCSSVGWFLSALVSTLYQSSIKLVVDRGMSRDLNIHLQGHSWFYSCLPGPDESPPGLWLFDLCVVGVLGLSSKSLFTWGIYGTVAFTFFDIFDDIFFGLSSYHRVFQDLVSHPTDVAQAAWETRLLHITNVV